MNNSCTFSNYEDILPQNLCYFQDTFSNVDSVVEYLWCKIPYLDFGTHHGKLVSIHLHLQNGVRVVHRFTRPTRESRRVQIWDVGNMGTKSLCHSCYCFPCAQIGVGPNIVVKMKKGFHVSVRTKCMETSDPVVLLNQRVSMILVGRYHCSCRPAASRLVSDLCFSIFKMPNPVSHRSHFNLMLPTHTLSRGLWISIRLNSSALRNSITALCFIRMSVTCATLYCLCVVFMWPIVAQHATEELETSTVQPMTRTAFCSAKFERKNWRHNISMGLCINFIEHSYVPEGVTHTFHITLFLQTLAVRCVVYEEWRPQLHDLTRPALQT
jgi:hypothetical protein